jgi:hypothetical protein
MSTVIPQSDKLKNAIEWISEKRNNNPDIRPSQLAEDASLRFDLSPRDSEFLLRFVKNGDYQNIA